MPKLPDSTVLGERPTPRPPSGAPSPQLHSEGGVVGEAGRQFGRSVQGVGDAITQVNEELVKARRGAQLTDALGKATMEIGELELAFKRDQDFRTAPERYAKQSEQVRVRMEQNIDDKLVRQAFTREFGKLNTAKHLNVLQSAATQESDYHQSALDTTLDVYAHSAANATNLAERELSLNQARLSIASTLSGGWITDVDAGKKERAFLAKVDGSTALRDLAVAPALTANKLALDPTYLPQLDVVHRERLVTAGYRQAEASMNRERQDAERAEREARDVTLTEAFKRMKDGTLTLAHVESIRNVVRPDDYKELRDSLGKNRVVKDDNASFARVYSVLRHDPDEAVSLAFTLQREGKLSNDTLASVVTKARELSRTDGPRSPYERSRAFITSSLEPSAVTTDPAPRARQGMAIKEFEDWYEGLRRNKQEPLPDVVEKKAGELIHKFSLVDMNKLAEKTGLGARNDPARVLEGLQRQAAELVKRRTDGTVTQQVYNRRMAELNALRVSAEKLIGAKP